MKTIGRRPFIDTEYIVKYFKAGFSIADIRRRSHKSHAEIENAIRRWMILYPEGKRKA